MSLESFNEDLNIISKLPDAPTLTAAQLKAKFDEGGLKIKEYINEQLLPQITDAINAQNLNISQSITEINESLPSLSNSVEDGSETKAASAKVCNELYGLINELEEQDTALKTLINNLTTLVNSKQNTITCGQGTPSGGENGDIYLMY